jgi:ABC-type sugar transport system ATPase subunit
VLGNLTPAIEFDSVSVSFGPIKALQNVSFSIRPGEIVGLLGHNGAGKSSVVNVATGAVPISEGNIYVAGEAVPKSLTPRLAGLLGAGVVHQEPALAPNLSVYDNMFLGRKEQGPKMAKVAKVRVALGKVQLDVPLGTEVASLKLGERQLLDIARSIQGADLKVLFLDEPTAALGKSETDKLHKIIRMLSEAGTAIVYVSHRIRDIEEICQRFLVLRDGEKVSDEPIAHLTPKLLARTLTVGDGEKVGAETRTRTISHSNPILTSSLGMHFGKGEIVGLFGMAAGEQFTFLASLFGIAPSQGLFLDGKPFAPKSPRESIEQNVFMVQADRENDSLLGNLSARENVSLPWQSSLLGGFGIDKSKVNKIYDESRRVFGVHGPAGSAPIGAFSGGNRQKHVLARWLVPQVPRMLLLAQPTQGVDEASKADIRDVLRDYADKGVTVLVASAESDEVARVCDRAYVMNGARVSEVFGGSDFEERLMESLLERSATIERDDTDQ